jgi:hypothetical protein
MLELIERAVWRVPSEWLERLRRTAGTSSPCVRPPKLIDPLIERERDVPRFLPAASLSPKSPTSYSSP